MTTQPPRRQRQIATPDLAVIPDKNEPVVLRWVVAFIADRWLPRLPSDIVREVRDKVGGQIRTAIRNGTLKPRADGRFIFGEVIAWARTKTKWHGLFDGLPTTVVSSTGGMTATGPRGMLNAAGYSSPETLPECKVALAAAWQQIRALEGELRASKRALNSAHEELLIERALADRWRNFIRKSGRKR